MGEKNFTYDLVLGEQPMAISVIPISQALEELLNLCSSPTGLASHPLPRIINMFCSRSVGWIFISCG
jgi:hypothetical protein